MDEPARATTPRRGLDLWSADRRQANRVKIIFDVQLIELSKTGARYTVKIFLSLSLRPNYFHCCYAPLYFCTLSAARSNDARRDADKSLEISFFFFFWLGKKILTVYLFDFSNRLFRIRPIMHELQSNKPLRNCYIG